MEGWKKMAFADVAIKFFSGGTPSTKDSSLWNGDIQWITSKWLNERLYLSYGEKNISKKGLRSSATKLVKARSLILATRVGVGKVSINEIDLAINQDLLGIEIDEHNNSLEFLAYQLRSQKSQDYISSFKRGATIQGVTQDCIKSIELNIPPLPEQRKIAHVLSTMQKAIEQQDKLIHTTTELKKALMQKLFTEGTRGEPQRKTEIGLVPVSWKVVEFPKFVLLQRGKDLTKKNFMDGDIPVAGSSGVIGYHNQSFVKAPGVTVGRSGSCGIVNYYEKDFWAHNTSLYVKDFNGNNEMFSFYYLQFLDIGKFKTGASVPTLDRNSLNTFEVPVPKKEEQKEIAKYIQTIESKIESSKKKKQTLTALFKTLLHELMTGQRRVHDLEFEKIEFI